MTETVWYASFRLWRPLDPLAGEPALFFPQSGSAQAPQPRRTPCPVHTTQTLISVPCNPAPKALRAHARDDPLPLNFLRRPLQHFFNFRLIRKVVTLWKALKSDFPRILEPHESESIQSIATRPRR